MGHVRKWKIQNQVADLGQCFVAIDPAAFTDSFPERLQSLLDTCRGLTPLDPELPVLVPGDRGRGREGERWGQVQGEAGEGHDGARRGAVSLSTCGTACLTVYFTNLKHQLFNQVEHV